MDTKIKHILFALLAIPFLGHSAKAPDFTVTDYNNKVHQLYADYLNKDKVVVIKFFFVGCPPCATVAPYVQQAYSRWNSGKSDVEFLQVSTMKGDMNSSVKNYSVGKGLTFPGVGFDGGAQIIYDQYRTGNFGPWYGTPTFVVIAPNGEVDYNVNMSAGNPYGLDTAISRALRLNNNGGGGGGNECTRKFEVKTITQVKPLGYYVVDLINGNQSQEIIDGKYNCEFQLPQDLNGYYVTAFTNLYIEPITNITTADIVHVQRHILGLKPFNNLQLAIADVNRSTTVTAADVSDIRKLILGVTNKFKNLTESYAVIHDPKSTDRSKMSNRVLLSKLLDSTDVNEFGVGQYGDVSSNILLKDGRLITRSDKKIELYTKVTRLPDGRFEHKVFSRHSIEIDAFQMSFSDPNNAFNDILLSAPLKEELEFEFAENDFQLKLLASSKSGRSVLVSANDVLFSLISNDDQALKLASNSIFVQEFILSETDIVHQIELDHEVTAQDQNILLYSSGNGIIHVNSQKKLSRIDVFDILGRPVLMKKINENAFQINELLRSLCFIKLTFSDNSTSIRSFILEN